MATYDANAVDVEYGEATYSSGDPARDTRLTGIGFGAAVYSPGDVGVDIPLGLEDCYVYRMRAYDQTEGRTVYWDADEVDTSGTQYTGPGPLTNVVVANIRE